MTKSEKKVADIVLSRPQDVLRATISDLAKLCDVGETSVFRFCRTLNLNGYQDFKLSLALDSASQNSSHPKDSINILASPDCRTTAQNVLQTYRAALDAAFSYLNFSAIDKTVELILSSKSINLFGFGGSGTTANETKNKFMKILPYVIFNPDSHIQLTQAALLGKRDLALDRKSVV